MPIEIVYKGKVKWYKWGSKGKLYRKRADAEKQARAIYSSGYKEKSK